MVVMDDPSHILEKFCPVKRLLYGYKAEPSQKKQERQSKVSKYALLFIFAYLFPFP